MSVAKITEVCASSPRGFPDAIQAAIERAARTLTGLTGAWVQDQYVLVSEGVISEYRVRLKVTFLLFD